MAKKNTTQYTCRQCGAVYGKWQGQCTQCSEWNTLEESILTQLSPGKRQYQSNPADLHYLKTGSTARRYATGILEIDRVLGGGLLSGAVLLLGGDPGIGKSTLALQLLSILHRKHALPAIYFSGEESIEQVSLRAQRLAIRDEEFHISQDMDVARIISAMIHHKPKIVVIDSIQTVFSPNSESLPGSIAQVRECATELMSTGKKYNIMVLMIGHITKDGNIAGPKMLEHLVDTVLYLEGDQNNYFRILRSVKNRFGATHDIGIFEMKGEGLTPVDNPAQMFLNERTEGTPGSVIACGVDSSRPLLVEVQALTARAVYGSPQRNANGIDPKRLSMLLAVIERHLKLPVNQFDVFVNVVGGLKFTEPAMDLAVIASIVSSLKELPIPEHSVFFGEAGLTGEIRRVSLMDRRIEESNRLGFHTLFIPPFSKPKSNDSSILKINQVHRIGELVEQLF